MRAALIAASSAIVMALAAAPAHAQIAAAIGKPLSSPDLPVGTISVKVVAGSPQNLVTGTDVTLVVNGVPRTARTDTAGRAIFKDLPAGAKAQAKVVDEDKKEITSDEFPVPSEGGARLLLSTKPFVPIGGGDAPFAGGGGEGAQGMPEPRQMSGEPRPEQADPPGSYTVRLTYDDFKDAPPVGVPVTLIGYKWDDDVSYAVVPTDKDGRATFTGLDKSGGTAYFAMAQLPRNGAIDRLMAQAAALDPSVGVRLVLSSDKRTATTPPIDELERVERQDASIPAGKVRVTLDGDLDLDQPVVLIDAQTRGALGQAKPTPGAPDPTNITGGSHYQANKVSPPGSLLVRAHGGAGTEDAPLAGVGVVVVPADAKALPEKVVGVQTAATGDVEVIDKRAGKLKAVLSINGRVFQSEPFQLDTSGGVLEVEAHWEAEGKPVVLLDTPADRTVFAETTVHGHTYRSIPFQPAAGHGTHVSMFLVPQRVLFSFSWTSRISDEYLIVGGRFIVYNNAWAPYRAGPDGLVIPLPRGFKSVQIEEQSQADVAAAPGEGLRLVRPVPPGQRVFHAQFALPVHGGKIDWSLDLPFGALQSGMEIQEVEGMHVEVPRGVDGQSMDLQGQGKFYVLPQISIRPGQSMVMTISGMPSQPGWKSWLPKVVGVLVVMMLLAGVALALASRKQPVDATREAKRARLLDELVELEKTGTDAARREAVLSELEQLWD